MLLQDIMFLVLFKIFAGDFLKNEINLSLLTPDNYYSKNFFKNLIYKINEKKNLFAIFQIQA